MKLFYPLERPLLITTIIICLFSQTTLGAVYNFNWKGQVAGFSVSGQFGFDSSQDYTDNIVRAGDLESFDVSFFSPDGTLLRTYANNHISYIDFNFGFDINNEEILQNGKFSDPDGLNIGEKTSNNSGGFTGLALWSRSKDTSPPMMHFDDWNNAFGFPIGYGSHEDVAFYTRTIQELIDTGKMGQYYIDNGTHLNLNQLGNPVQVSAVPLPSAALLFASSLLLVGSRLRKRI